jgi:hypothetical protein
MKQVPLVRRVGRWHALGWVLPSVILFTSAPASADPARTTTPAPLSETLTGDAKAEYEAARLLFDDADYVGAAAKFNHAHELSADPRLLWNVAVCEKELRHYARASALVERYLAEAGNRLTEENRRSANETLAALRGFFSRLTLTGVPAGAQVLVDDGLVGTAPLAAPLELDLGSRKIRAERSGDEPFEQTLEVPGNSEMTLAVVMRPLPVTAHLIITTQADGVIRLDDRVLGSGRWEGGVAPGRHQVRVVADNRKPFETQIELAPRQSRTLDVTLVANDKAVLWPWIAGGAAIAVGAAVGGYFLFRKDESGSAPQGALGTVYLPLRVR